MRLEKVVCALWVGTLILALPAPGLAAAMKTSPAPAYVRGYSDALLQRQLGWRPGHYRLSFRNGRMSVTPPATFQGSAKTVRKLLESVPGIASVRLSSTRTQPTTTGALTATSGHSASVPIRPHGKSGFVLAGGEFSPRGLLFRPLLADPKQPAFFASYRVYWMPFGTYNVGAVGYGGTLGLYRWTEGPYGGQLQVDFAAGAFSQFDLGVSSPVLVNTDFTVGIPVTWRRGANSLRVELMHQSSHLGPRYFANYHPSGYALSFEKLSALGSHRWQRWRLYGGGGYLLWPVPTSLKRPFLQSGLEYRGPRFLDGYARFVGGLDVQSWAENAWEPNISLKLGLAYAGPDPAKRTLRVMLEAFSGHSPNGQFYKYQTRYVGIGAYLGF